MASAGQVLFRHGLQHGVRDGGLHHDPALPANHWEQLERAHAQPHECGRRRVCAVRAVLQPCYLAILLSCYLAILLSCYLATLLYCYLVACYLVAVQPAILQPCYRMACYLVTWLPCDRLPCDRMTSFLVNLLPARDNVTRDLVTCALVNLLPCNLRTLVDV